MKIKEIVQAIEEVAPLRYQESWDNSGLQTGNAEDECTGVLLCVDVTPEIIAEAKERGFNMILSHHPRIFRGIKRLTGEDATQRTIIDAIRSGIAIYCSHTPIDSTSRVDGISLTMARKLGVESPEILVPQKDQQFGKDGEVGFYGLGAIGDLKEPVTDTELVEMVKKAFDAPVVRANFVPSGKKVSRIAMCGGAGAEFIPVAKAKGAQAYLTADTRHHEFLDYEGVIDLMDIGHYESEKCAEEIFFSIITNKFPNFAVGISRREHDVIRYL